MNRWYVLGPALIGTAALVLLGDPQQDAEVVAARPSRPAAATAAGPVTDNPAGRTAAASSISAATTGPRSMAAVAATTAPQTAARKLPPLLRSRALLYPPADGAAPRRDLFAGKNWNPPPVAVVEVPPAPVAPDFPYAVVGKQRDGKTWEVFLTKDDVTMVLKEGQAVDDSFKIVQIDPPTLTVVYVPMNHIQRLPIGDAD